MSKGTRTKSSPKKKKASFKAVSGKQTSSVPSWWSKWSAVLFLAICVLIFFQARLQLLSIPLERDEGAFAYIGHWLLRGKQLYTDMLDSKLPGLYALYALFTGLFGYNATGVHMGLLICNSIAAVFFFFLVREFINHYAAGIATSFFLILIMAPNVMGFAAHATQLLLPFVLGGCWLFWKGIQTGRFWHFFLSGLLIGIAFTIKQQTVVFGILLAIIWWLYRLSWKKKENTSLPILEWIFLGIGGLLPVAGTLVYFQVTGRLDDFIFWTYQQPLKLSASMKSPWHELLSKGFKNVVAGHEALYIIAAAGMVLVFFSGLKRDRKWFALLFIISCIVSIAIGVGFYAHYFVVIMPAVAMCIGVVLYWVSQKTGPAGMNIGLAAGAILIAIPLMGGQDYYFNPDHVKIHQEIYGANMFPEIETLGKELKKRIPAGGKLAVLGSEPEVLVAAQREACTRHLMVYSMITDPENAQEMQDEYYHDITNCGAEYLVFDVFPTSWAPGYEELGIHKKNMAWLEANMVMEGIAEYREGLPGIILWGDAARNHKTQSNLIVYVFKRKS